MPSDHGGGHSALGSRLSQHIKAQPQWMNLNISDTARLDELFGHTGLTLPSQGPVRPFSQDETPLFSNRWTRDCQSAASLVRFRWAKKAVYISFSQWLFAFR